MENLSKQEIIDALKSPATITPRQIMEMYLWLSSLFAEQHVELSACMATMAVIEADAVAGGATSAAAKQAAKGSEDGIKSITLKGALAGTEQLINALKKAQGYMADEARNRF